MANWRSLFSVVAPAKVLLEPHVKADEQIAAAHLLDLELGLTGLAIVPGDRQDGPTETAHNSLQGQFHCQVEVRGDQRPASLNNFPAIGFEGVGGVVEPDRKEGPDEE